MKYDTCDFCRQPIKGVSVAISGRKLCRACLVAGRLRDTLRDKNKPAHEPVTTPTSNA